MANYYGVARTNYFRVKDPAAFAAWVDKIGGAELITDDEDKTRCGLLFEEGIPSSIENEQAEECEDFDLPAGLAEHLQPGSVAVLMEAGAEKLRYITGFAIAINHLGQRKEVGLGDIYELAKGLGDEITPCEY